MLESSEVLHFVRVVEVFDCKVFKQTLFQIDIINFLLEVLVEGEEEPCLRDCWAEVRVDFHVKELLRQVNWWVNWGSINFWT